MKRIVKIARDEEGVSGVLFALMMVVIIGFVGVAVDVGNLFMHKTRLQNAADAAVLSAMNDLDNSIPTVRSVVEHGNIVPDALKEMSIVRGAWNEDTQTFIPATDGAALEVKLDEEVPLYFLRVLGLGSPQLVSGKATGILRQAGAVVKLGATAISINTDEALLLQGLLGSMLGTALNISAVGWQGLVNAQLDLVKFINLAKLNLGIATTEGLLDAQLSVGQILELMAEVLHADDATASATLQLLEGQLHASIAPINTELRLGDLLQVDLNRGALAKADINALSMVTALAELFNHDSAVSLDTTVSIPGVLDVDLKVKIVEPPVIKIMQEGSTIHSAGARVYLDARVGSLLGGLLTSSSLLHVPLYLELGSGDAELTDISAAGVELQTSSSLAKVYLGDIDESFFFSDSTLDAGDFSRATIIDLNLLGLLQILRADARSFINASGGGSTITVPPEEFGQTFHDNNQLGGAVGGLVGSLLGEGNLDLVVTLLGLGLDIGQVTNNLLADLASGILSPLLSALLNPISMLTGVYPGRTDVTVYDYAYEAVLVQ